MNEISLKMKEMTLTRSEPFHVHEFRHGPMSMITEGTMMVGLVADKNSIQEITVLDEMKILGAKVLAPSKSPLESLINLIIVFSSQLSEEIRGVLNLPILQLMALYRSLAKGLNPNQPTNLTVVVRLNL